MDARDRRLARDADGRLYDPDLRAVAGPALPPDRLLAVEAVVALQQAAFALTTLARGVRNSIGAGDRRMRLLMRLHSNPAGVPEAELDGAPLDELAQAGMLTRDGAVARLSDDGKRRMDQALGSIAERLVAATAGLGADELAVLRHVCLTLVRNQREASA